MDWGLFSSHHALALRPESLLMSRFSYEFEDHSYKTQAEVFRVLSDVSEVKICRPGKHAWVKMTDGLGPEACTTCHLVRFPQVPVEADL